MGKWLILAAIAVLGVAVQADDILSTMGNMSANQPPDCTSYREIVGKYLHLPQFTESKETNGIVSEVCKRLPDREQVSAVAYGYARSGADEDDKNLTFALINDSKHSVIASYTSDVAEDALTKLGSASFSIDTARYRLREDVRAIGLRYDSAARGPSCADGASWSWLILFVQSGSRLEPILDLPLGRRRSFGDCGHGGGESAEITIGVEQTRHHGYADLRLTAHVEPYGAENERPEKSTTQTYVLHFDGKHYVPDGIPPWWAESLSSDIVR